jgi:hypothetical protein
VKLRFFGDSYDVVKQSLLRWLADTGSWAVHPMFTETVTSDGATAFSRFLGADLVSTDPITSTSDRGRYLAPVRAWQGNVFLDPDTGLRLDAIAGRKAPAYLFAKELQDVVHARPGRLTLVFDQCLPRGSEIAALRHKMASLLAGGVTTLAYTSHACFVLASDSPDRIAEAHRILMAQSRLPESRIIVGPQNNEMHLTTGHSNDRPPGRR